MDERLAKLEQAISMVTHRVDDLSTRLAVKDEREKHVDGKLEDIKRDVEKQTQLISRVGWLITATIIGAFMKFVLDGGLHNVGP